MAEAKYQIRSSRDGAVIAAAVSDAVSSNEPDGLAIALGERFADRLPPDYRQAYEASWDDLFAVVGAARSFDTVVEMRSGFWSVHIHEASALAGDEVVVNSEVVVKAAIDDQRGNAAPEPDPTNDFENETDPASADAAPSGATISVTAPSGATDRDAAEDDDDLATDRKPLGVGARRLPTVGELTALAVLVALAALFRFTDVASIPTGLHGDEAITGMEGWRVQAEGNIGVYTGSGLGQPTLMYYPLAVVQRVFGDGISTIRGFAAMGGLVSVVLVWWATRRHFGVVSALGAAAALAVMVWSVHYSRIAFSLAWWPAFAVLGVYLLDRAIEKNSGWLWAASGFVTGLGIYVYNAHWMFGAAVALFMTGWLVVNYRAIGTYGRGVAIFVVSGLVTIAPMLRLILRGEIGGHVETIGIQATPAWQSATWGTKFGLIVDGYRFAWNQLLAPTMIDYSDGAGVIAPLGAPLLAMAIAGAAFGAWRFRSRTIALALVIIAVMPIATAVTAAGHGPFRRDFVMAPFIAILVGLFIGEFFEAVSTRLRPLAASTIAVVPLLLVAVLSRQAYFGIFAANQAQKWIFAGEIIGPATVIDEYGDTAFVNFYSSRHPFAYESIRYLAPDAIGVDRSAEFGKDTSFDPWHEAAQPQLYVLIGPYTTRLDELVATVNGDVVASGESAGVPFVAYLTSS